MPPDHMLLKILYLFSCIYLIKSQEVTFIQVSEPYIITNDATLTCSITDYVANDEFDYWVEYSGNASTSNNIFSVIYNDKLEELSSHTITNTTGLTSASNELSCANYQENIIFTSYTIGYRDNISSPLPLKTSIYYKIYNIFNNELSSGREVFNGNIPPYNDNYTSFNFNLNGGITCNNHNDNEWYLLSWYHWDLYETYLQFRIIYRDKFINEYRESGIISAFQSIEYNVSLFISTFGRSKHYMSKSDNSIFIAIYNGFDVHYNNYTEYANNSMGIIGKVYFDNELNDYNIIWITSSSFILNQIINNENETRSFATGSTIHSGYTKLIDKECCFMIIYGVSWINEVWGINKIYLTVINDAGKHVIRNDVLIHTLGPDNGSPIFGYYGTVNIIELENLRTNKESYFTIGYTVNKEGKVFLNSNIYKINYHINGYVEVTKLNEYMFVDLDDGYLDIALSGFCWDTNSINNQLLTVYSKDNFTDETNVVYSTMIATLYNISLV